MKRKPFAGVMLAGLLAASMVLPAMAATNANISMTGTATGYEAYRLLDLDTSLKNDHEEHDGSHTDDCYAYHYSIPEGSKYAAAMKGAAGDTSMSDDALLSYIEGLNDDAAQVRAFADAVFKAIDGKVAADATATDKTFANIPQGYYLIAESALSGTPNESRSLVMLSTAGHRDVVVSAKEGVPTLTKQILEKDDTKGTTAWQDGADHDIGDAVSFRLIGTLPANYDGYETYKYIFHDTLSSGLKLDTSSIKVTASTKGDLTANAVVRTTDTDGCTFEVEFENLKALGVVAGETITVEYDAELTTSAAVGQAGNDNKALLEFSNDPYNSDKTGKTPEDTVIAFTYKLTVDKVDGKNNPLAGANFKLQKKDSTGAYVDYRTIEATNDQTQFSFIGLDAGEYKLVETKVPAGYNKADDVEFEVVAVYDATVEAGQVPALKTLQVKRGDMVVSEGEDAEFSATVSSGEMSTRIVNTTGIHLPSTGGRGVYLVYAAGGIALVGGAGLLVMKKRKDNAEA